MMTRFKIGDRVKFDNSVDVPRGLEGFSDNELELI